MQDALLPTTASGVSDLLPSNTQIFSSTVRYGRLFYIIAATSGIVGILLLLASSRAGVSAVALVGAGLGILAVGAGACGVLAWRAHRAYAAQLRNGEWHEGVIVFSSGDVVVRFSGIFGNVERTIEAVYLSRADVERRCAPHVCGLPRQYLKIYHLGIDARPSVVYICETDLRESVFRVADYINALKAQNMSAF